MTDNRELEVMLAESLTSKEYTTLTMALESEETKGNFLTSLYEKVLFSFHRCLISIKKNDMARVTLATKGDCLKHPYFKQHGVPPQIAVLFTKSDNEVVRKIGEDIITIGNFLQRHRANFMKSFQAQCPACTAMYTTMVLACVQASSYAIGIEASDKVTDLYKSGADAVAKSAALIKTGQAEKLFKGPMITTQEAIGDDVMNYFVKNKTQSNAVFAVIPAVIIALMGFFMTGKFIVFKIYESKSNTADYLAQQALYLQMNADAVEANENIPLEKRQQIAERQRKAAERLLELSDKIAVDGIKAGRKAQDETRRDNKVIIEDAKHDISVNPNTTPSETNQGVDVLF